MIYPLTDKGLTIGRDPLSDILINDPEVSRQHALLSRTPTGDYRIQDLGSTNGTYIDGKRLGSESIVLQPSDTITMGGAVILVFRERSTGANLHGQERVIGTQDRVPQKSGKDPSNQIENKGPAVQPERDRRESAQSDPPKQKPQKVVIYPSAEEIPGPTQIETITTQELSPNLILGLVLLLLCSCASILVFLVYLGGDWFFREIGLVP